MSEKVSNSIYIGFGTLEIILLLGLPQIANTDNSAFLWVMPIALLLVPCVRWYKNIQERSRTK